MSAQEATARPEVFQGAVAAEHTRLLKAPELAERWGVSTALVYRLSREGHLPAVRIGRNFRYRLAVVEAFEAAGGASLDA